MIRALIRNPLTWILLAAAVVRLAGLGWGLPASDGWDNDGFAPRNFLTALALTWKPGAFFTYPPLQGVILGILTAPGIALALLRAPSWHQAAVIATFISPGYMTFFAVVGRLVNLAMSLGIIWTVSQMAQLAANRRAAVLAGGACALDFGLTYYGQVSNLDVPYLFWGGLALLWGMRALAAHDLRRFWPAGLFAAAALATKDQAYGLFLLALPGLLLLWFCADPWARRHARAVLASLVGAVATGLLLVLAVDGALTNPHGFLRRIAFLTGPASQDYAHYLHAPLGWLALAGDIGGYFLRGPGIVAVTLLLLGLVLTGMRSRGPQRVAGLVPVLALVSFTLCFNFVALRSEDRFLLPQSVLACVYIGIAAEALVFAQQAWVRLPARVVLAVAALLALHLLIAIDAAMLFDPRYQAEAWLKAHVRSGDVVQTYGQNCFLPRFPQGLTVLRVGEGALTRRNPLPGVREIRAVPGRAEGRLPPARFLVLSIAWARRYLAAPAPLPPGRISSPLEQRAWDDLPARDFFSALVAGRRGYRLVFAASYRGFWPQVHIHDSLDEPVWIFERVP